MKENYKNEMIFGRHPILDALKNGVAFERILLQKGLRGEIESEIRKLSAKNNVALQIVPKEKLNRTTSKNHQGIIGYLALIKYYQIEDIIPHIYEKGETPLILLLDQISDVRNFGAIARSAELLGVHAIVIGMKGSAKINGEAIKTSAGALLSIPVCKTKSIISVIELLKLNGIQIVTSSLEAKNKLPMIDFTTGTAIIIGSEGFGVSSSIVESSDDLFIIPQLGETDSFNVSVATGIILYEAVRQRDFKRV